MNKKADTTVWQEFIKAIPSVIVLLLLFWGAIKVWNAFHPEQFTSEQKDIDRIIDEIKDLKKDGQQITVPLFSPGYEIIIKRTDILKNEIAGTGCNLDYCICFRKRDGSRPICDTFSLRKEYDLSDEESKDINFQGTDILSERPITLKRESNKKVLITN